MTLIVSGPEPGENLDNISSRRCSTPDARGLVDADFSPDSVAIHVVVAAAAEAANVAEGAGSTLGSVLRELGIGCVHAGLKLDTDIVGVARARIVAGAADVAREAVGVGSALGNGCSGEDHAHGDDGGLDGDLSHFVIASLLLSSDKYDAYGCCGGVDGGNGWLDKQDMV